jgi:hypothetical protein
MDAMRLSGPCYFDRDPRRPRLGAGLRLRRYAERPGSAVENDAVQESKIANGRHLHVRPALRHCLRDYFCRNSERENRLTVEAVIVEIEIVCGVKFKE